MRYLAIIGCLAACGTSVDPAGLPSIEGYTDWYREQPDDTKEVPGHGDSIRRIYVNDIGVDHLGGKYQIGTVFVKEVHNRDGLTPTDLRYLAVMRKVGDDADVNAPVYGGWVFTELSSADAEETSRESCWSTCHRQAPYDGAWYDHPRANSP
jgi:hypothetical protein